MKDWARENPLLVFAIILAALSCIEGSIGSLTGHHDQSIIRVGCGS